MSKDNKEIRRGGLGRGLAALIPTAPEQQPRVGDDAADIIFGRSKTTAANENSSKTRPGSVAQDMGLKRNSDGNTTTASSGRGTTPSRSANVEGSKGSVPVDSESVSVPAAKKRAPTDVSHETSTTKEHTRSTESVADSFGATYQEIPLEVIAPNPRQPREVFDEEPLKELAHSIREFGLMQPIVVRVMPAQNRELARAEARKENAQAADPEFEIIMGERRWRASQLAGETTIPAIIRETDDNAMLRDALLENIHRVQLNPLEEAAAYQQLLDEFKVTQAQLADKIGRSRPVITNMIRLLKLPVDVQRRVAAGVLSAGHARALLGIKVGKEAQSQLAERIVAEGLSVRATEEAVTLINRGDEQRTTKKREPVAQPERLSLWADRLADTFDTKVTASMGKRKGKLVIEFGDLEDFDRIMSLLQPGAEE